MVVPSHSEKRRRSRKKSSISRLNDDLLLQILIRLHSLGNAITVWKRWYSLITDPEFLHSYICHHSQTTLPYTILFKPPNEKKCMQISSKTSKILLKISGKLQDSDYLGFLPSWGSMTFRASFNDLLVVSRTNSHYYICNPVSREWVALPEAPKNFISKRDVLRVELVTGEAKSPLMDKSYIFKVVILKHGPGAATSIVFSSEHWAWTKSNLTLMARPLFDHATTRAGLVHWLEFDFFISRVKGICAFDPFKAVDDPSRCHVINFPVGFGMKLRRDFKLVLRLGVVKGRLRLSQLVADKNNESNFRLRIWDLNEFDDWDLKHDIRLEKGIFTERVVVIAFHPDDGDVIFLLRDLEIYRYEIKESKDYKIGEFSAHKFRNGIKGQFLVYLHVFALVHPRIFPTKIPLPPPN